MSLLRYPLLVSDIDGTLLNNDKEISRHNMESISRFCRMGGLFTLATGRSYMEAKRYIEQLEPRLPVILCNGAVLYEPASESVIPVHTMPRELMLSLLHELERKLPSSVDLFAYGLNTVYATRMGPLAEAGVDQIDFHVEMLGSFEQIPDILCIKVIAVASGEDMKLLLDWSKTADFPVDFIPSSDNYFEILPAGASKGNALSALLKKIGLTPDKAAAIGDHCNDLSMLSLAGLGAAVANAHPAVLQQAKVIVPSNNEDGVAHLIHNHLMFPVPQAKTP
ncbi:Cof-type HAD-IIB family hydrolase [Lihuaxuella thermophila]|uniref:Cof subfamily of IIB subfamily of haloacid dehalogenase superfamily/HAD-superfamily hydrolase, subfamily IIB n=1 Tax=Lihuaxuella thermophila TaxID=1173111 RepID=A0A1H8H8P4_9BACL|nr:Cof-type HAD-IIB family hydrolase [Lihuaxuella thermophila]SEN52576.1 hypothetical protein SAMN05444955_11392 [Lihuaxuella thermophila]